MARTRLLVAIVAVGIAAGAASASASTPAQFGKKCRDQWQGPRSGPAFGSYLTRCVRAATNATSAATDAGNPTNPVANAARSRVACGAQFPPPRATAARRAAFAACVRAANASQLAFAGRPLKATLSSANETPPHTAGTTGSALIRLNQGRRRVCFTVTLTGLVGAVAGGHIHRGAAGVAGPVVIGLPDAALAPLGAGAPARGCVQGVATSLIKEIRQFPGRFYLNIHTTTFPGGVARGQLRR
jgi:hypothetical protein